MVWTSIRRVAWGVFVTITVLTALYTVAGRVLMAQADRWRVPLMETLGRELGRPIHIAHLDGDWRGLEPVLVLQDLTVGDATRDDNALVQLASLTLQPDVLGSLWQRRPLFRKLSLGSLTVDLEGLSRLLSSIESSPSPTSALSAHPDDWVAALSTLEIPILSFEEILVRMPPSAGQDELWRIEGLALQRRNQRIRGGGRILRQRDGVELAQLIVDATQNDRGVLSGRAYFDWSSAGFFLPLNQWLARSGIQVDDAESRGALWVDVAGGRFTRLIATTETSRLAWRREDQPQPPLERLAFDLLVEAEDSGQWHLFVDRLHLAWQGQSLLGPRLALHRAPDGQLALDWDWIDLGATAAAAEVLMPAADMALWKAYQPVGRLTQARLRLPGIDSAFAFAARLDDVSVAAVDGAPAGRNIDGWIEADGRGGRVVLDARAIGLHFPELFSQGWTFDRAQGEIRWDLHEDSFVVSGRDLLFTDPDARRAQVSGNFRLFVADHPTTPSELIMRVGVSEAEAILASRLTPDRLVNPGLMDWLQTAIQGGEVGRSGYHFAGLIGEFAPPGRSVSELFVDLRDGALQYHPDWPALQDFDASLVLRDGELQAEIARGTLGETRLSAPAQLRMQGEGSGRTLLIRADQRLQQRDIDFWLEQTPLRALTGDAFSGWTLGGSNQLQAEIQLPLGEQAETRVDLDLLLRKARFAIPSPGLQCDAASGAIRYRSRHGVTGDVSASCEGQPTQLNLSTLAWSPENERLQLQLDTQLDVAYWLERLGLAEAGGVLAGQTALALQYELPIGRGDHRVEVVSDLIGLAIDLPTPLARSAEVPGRLSLNGQWREGIGGSRWQLRWQDVLSGEISLEQGQLSRGLIVFGPEGAHGLWQPELATRGLWLGGRLAQFDSQAWGSALTRVSAVSASVPTPAGDGAADPAPARALPEWIGGLQLRVDRLQIGNLVFSGNDIMARRDAGDWLIAFDNRESLTGEVRIPAQAEALPEARFQRLHLPVAEGAAGDKGLHPDDLPRARVRIDALRLGDRDLGSWSWVAEDRDQGVVLNDLEGNLSGGEIRGRLSWIADPQTRQQTTILIGSVAGSALETFYGNWTPLSAPLTSKRFHFDAGVVWYGAPTDFDWKNLNGQIGFSMENGAFRETRAGADLFRVFGILNTDAITRRLKLDFSDLYDEGLAYDRIEGRARIENGVVDFVSPLAIQAPSSAFKITGKTSLVDDSLDMRMVVVLPLTKNLPLAALLVGAPQVGGALFLIDRLIGDPLSRLTSATYQIRGTLQSPEVSLQQLFDSNPETKEP